MDKDFQFHKVFNNLMLCLYSPILQMAFSIFVVVFNLILFLSNVTL